MVVRVLHDWELNVPEDLEVEDEMALRSGVAYRAQQFENFRIHLQVIGIAEFGSVLKLCYRFFCRYDDSSLNMRQRTTPLSLRVS